MMREKDLVIRQATSDDVDAILALYLHELNRPGSRELVTSSVSTNASCVALYKGELVAFSYCSLFAPDVVELKNITVGHEWQGMGIGSSMLRELERQCVELGFTSVILVNSALYPPMRYPFRDGTNFYEKNRYILLTKTDGTNIFYKRLLS